MNVNIDLIKVIRAINNLSQRDLAEKMGLSHGYIAMLELGNKPVTRNFSDKFKEVNNLTENDIALLSSVIYSLKNK